MSLKIGKLVVGIYSTNCYFLYEEGKTDVILADVPDHGKEIYEKLKDNGYRIGAVLLTHGHFDHIWGVEGIRKAALEDGNEDLKIYANEAEERLLKSPGMNESEDMGRPCSVKADVWLKDGEELTICGIKVKCIATPGHTEGGMCFYFEDGDILVAGDTLFYESVGRTDFPTGSMSTLIRSIQDKLYVLPEKTLVYPGHGESTTIGHEKTWNPFTVEA
ncbi:MAG: MBL fold metallo-hydrolase [Lachnospiraceae bacterium]|nr:MBL fold metallo-hydrolase [Lachnospiraceae bacterium]